MLDKLFVDFSCFRKNSIHHKWIRVAEDLGSKKISYKSLKYLGLIASSQSATKKANFESCSGKILKISSKTFHMKNYSK